MLNAMLPPPPLPFQSSIDLAQGVHAYIPPQVPINQDLSSSGAKKHREKMILKNNMLSIVATLMIIIQSVLGGEGKSFAQLWPLAFKKDNLPLLLWTTMDCGLLPGQLAFCGHLIKFHCVHIIY